jgi:hypothetical protein
VSLSYLCKGCPCWRRGAVGIASASGTKDPGSIPDFIEIIALLLLTIDLICIVGVLKREIKALAKKIKNMFS